jgi:hypothetical protein
VGNGFPGLAVVSLIALLGALALAILLVLQPWAPTSIAPELGLAPDTGVGLGAAKPVAAERAFAVAPAQRAQDGGAELVAAGASAPGSGSKLVSGLAPARAVARSAEPTEAVPEAPQPPEPQPVPEPEQPLPPPSPEPPPAPVPVVAPAPAPAESSPQAVAAVPSGPAVLGGGPQTAGTGKLGAVEGETPGGEEAEESEEAEEGEGEEEREDECTPPFSLAFEGTRHEVAVCFEAFDGEAGLYLLIDGELIDIDTWGNQPPSTEPEGAEPALP